MLVFNSYNSSWNNLFLKEGVNYCRLNNLTARPDGSKYDKSLAEKKEIFSKEGFKKTVLHKYDLHLSPFLAINR